MPTSWRRSSRASKRTFASLHSALATLEKDYAETAAACTPAAAKRGVDVAETAPQESIQVLEGLSKILDDGAYLNAAYTSYLAQCDANQAQPEPAALWISKAARWLRLRTTVKAPLSPSMGRQRLRS